MFGRQSALRVDASVSTMAVAGAGFSGAASFLQIWPGLFICPFLLFYDLRRAHPQRRRVYKLASTRSVIG